MGANAVNGVINIITKNAEGTQGGLLIGGGTRETGFGALRYGKQLAEDTYGRVYVKGFQWDSFKTLSGSDNAGDSWDKQQGGFRVDSRLSDRDERTVQGDLYRAGINQALTVPSLSSPTFQQGTNDKMSSEGWNLISRLRHKFSTTAEYSLQFYYDHTHRDEFYTEQSLDTLDVDFQNNFELSDRQNAIWGLGYRTNMDKFKATSLVSLNPSSRNTQLFTAFVQDEITLIDDALWLTIGSKFEHNDYTGFEGQPNARLMWALSPKQRVWASFSRSVRTPARTEHDLSILRAVLPPKPGVNPFPTAISINGNRNFQSEVLFAYELGYRFTLSQRASLDMTAFYNDYDRLRSTNQGAYTITGFPNSIYVNQPFSLNNSNHANTVGFELATIWQMTHWWRWDTNYSYIHTHIEDFQNNPSPISPQHKVSVRAAINPVDNVNLDFWLRYNSAASALIPLNPLTSQGSQIGKIKGYVTLDVRLAWKPLPALELSLVGQNLLDDHHLEYMDEGVINPTTIPRSVYGKVAVEF